MGKLWDLLHATSFPPYSIDQSRVFSPPRGLGFRSAMSFTKEEKRSPYKLPKSLFNFSLIFLRSGRRVYLINGGSCGVKSMSGRFPPGGSSSVKFPPGTSSETNVTFRSYTPASQPFPLGRDALRWSIVRGAPLGYVQPLVSTSIALLPMERACVLVGPPLFCKAETIAETAPRLKSMPEPQLASLTG